MAAIGWSVLAGAALVWAGAVEGARAQPPQVEVRHVAARLVVIPDARSNVSVTVAQGAGRLPPLSVRQEGGRIIVDGGLERPFGAGPGGPDCRGGPGQEPSVEVAGIGRIAYNDLPVITAHVPLDARIASEGAVYGQVGPSRSLQLARDGCGRWTLGAVHEALNLAAAGSGDVRGGDAGRLQAQVSGAVDLQFGRVSNGADIGVAGSGSLRADAVEGSLRVRDSGSGAVAINQVDGPVLAQLAGSGDLRIKGGHAPEIRVECSGSAQFVFEGQAGRVDAATSGSGGVRIAHASGPVSQSSSGSGEIDIGR